MDDGKEMSATVQGHRETEECLRCQGKCCKRQSGHCLPSEFGSEEEVRAAISSGRYGVVLLIDKDIVARIVRPSYKDLEWRVGCIFQHEQGCELSWEQRPYGCRMLRPRQRDDEHCKPEGISIVEAAEMWEDCGYLPPLSACLDNYPMLRLGRPS